MKNNITLLLIVLSLSIIACQSEQSFSEEPPTVTYRAEELRYFTSFDQLAPLLKINNDTTYVFNFWATWCKPCVKELPFFEKAWKEFRNKKVKIVLISLDFPEETEEKLISFLNKHQLHPDIWVLYDVDIYNWMPKVDETWKNSAIPATLIRHNGKRSFHSEAFPDYTSLKKEIKKLM